MFPFIFENSPLSCIIAIFLLLVATLVFNELNNIILELSTFSSLLKSCSTSGTASAYNLLHGAWQGTFSFEKLL